LVKETEPCEKTGRIEMPTEEDQWKVGLFNPGAVHTVYLLKFSMELSILLELRRILEVTIQHSTRMRILFPL
jgi:hypothetical protein